ncbi:uncharacterized protein LOC126572538 [Anopheles aquasalis]|uniref:uncharacterized protein LOC126572538 n=1 Tax=Anopheles aquasalis TaxID=42839 RepID=UPI00215ABBF5|nr:uncharacterized protein LOC126572538 [Anopheles aquasalis]
MGSSTKTKLIAGCGIILVVGCLLSPHGCHGASTVPSRTVSDPAHHPRGGSSVPRFDTKAKLVGFNRAVGERLQRTETDLRPLQRRAARLERLVSNFQHKRPALQKRKDGRRGEASNLERNGLLREANRLRTDVDRKLLGFRELDRNYRNVRQLLPSPGSKGATVAAATTSALPRAWLDRDTERQMEQNERVYKNIINLLVQLIEVPVNIIHDMIGDGGADGEATGPAAFPPNGTDYPGGPPTEQATEPNEYAFDYDEEDQAFLPETTINAVDGAAPGPANVVQDAEWVQFHY